MEPSSGRVRTVLDAVITDLMDTSATEAAPRTRRHGPEWMTVTGFAQRSRVARPTLIRRLTAWFDLNSHKGLAPWSHPVTCPIYRHGRRPRGPRKGHAAGCWLLDASREAAIRRELRNVSRPSAAERGRAREIRARERRSKGAQL